MRLANRSVRIGTNIENPVSPEVVEVDLIDDDVTQVTKVFISMDSIEHPCLFLVRHLVSTSGPQSS